MRAQRPLTEPNICCLNCQEEFKRNDGFKSHVFWCLKKNDNRIRSHSVKTKGQIEHPRRGFVAQQDRALSSEGRDSGSTPDESSILIKETSGNNQ